MCYVGGLLWRFGNLIKWVVSNRNVSNAGFEENSNLRTSKGVLAQLVAPFHRFHTKIVCVSLFEGTPCLLQMLCILVFSTFLPRTPYYLCYLCVATIFVRVPCLAKDSLGSLSPSSSSSSSSSLSSSSPSSQVRNNICPESLFCKRQSWIRLQRKFSPLQSFSLTLQH